MKNVASFKIFKRKLNIFVVVSGVWLTLLLCTGVVLGAPFLLMAENSNPINSTLIKAQKQFRSGEVAAAVESFTLVLAKEKKNVMALLGRSTAYLNLQSYEKARADLSAAIKLLPTKSTFYVRRAHIFALQKKYDSAIADYTLALKINPGDGLAYFHRANMYMAIKDRKRALNDYKQSIRYSPQNVESYVRRGKLNWLLGRELAAIRDFNTLLDNNKAKSVERKNNVKNLEEISRIEGAQKLQFIISAQQEADIVLHRAYCYVGLSSYVNAQKDYEAVILAGFFRDKALLGRAVLLKKLGKFKEAIADYNTVIELRPSWAVAHFNRANVLRVVGREDEAIKDYEEVVVLTSASIKVYEGSKEELRIGNVSKARQDPDLYVTRAKAYLAVGKNEQAINSFLSAYEIFKLRNDEFNINRMIVEIQNAIEKK